MNLQQGLTLINLSLYCSLVSPSSLAGGCLLCRLKRYSAFPNSYINRIYTISIDKDAQVLNVVFSMENKIFKIIWDMKVNMG